MAKIGRIKGKFPKKEKEKNKDYLKRIAREVLGKDISKWLGLY